jgi:MurNAc alpha-1-phosphate uridylyltransferase
MAFELEQAFILGAGIGARMRPLTDTIPKPMVPVHGKPIIAYALESIARHGGIRKVVVNTHYRASVLEDYLRTRSDLPFEIVISYEPDLLDTGGGLQNGMQYLDHAKPVLVVAGDSIWENPFSGPTTLQQMQEAWDPAAMDMLFLLQSLDTMQLTRGIGDYTMVDGKPRRSQTQTGDTMWTSVRILKTSLFEPARRTPFSFLEIMDETEEKGRLSAIIHHGEWHHLSTPDDVQTLNTLWQPPT